MPSQSPERSVTELRAWLPQQALDLLDCKDGRYSEWATASAVCMHAMNAGLSEAEFVAVTAESDFAYQFATEDHGRDRSNRLASRLSKVWSRCEDDWNPPLGSAEDVRHKLAELSQRLAGHSWPGRTGNSDRAVAMAMVDWAHEVGTWTLDAGGRELSIRANVAHGTAKKALTRLQTLGVLRRDTETRQGTHAQRWVLNLRWGIRLQTDPHDLSPGGRGLCGLNKSLNHPAFLRSALGPTAERVWLDLVEHPDSTAAEVADRLGKRRTAVTKVLAEKLIPNQLVRQAGHSGGTRGKPAAVYETDPAGSLDRVAEAYGVADWRERTAERYRREREGYRAVQAQRQQRAAPQSDTAPEHAEPPATTDPFTEQWWAGLPLQWPEPAVREPGRIVDPFAQQRA